MATYPIAPWLHPQDTVGPYVQGLHLGAQLQQERQRLSQQAAEAAVRAQMQQEQMERESMIEQQRIEVSKAQQQQEVALKQQELAQHQQTIQMATEQAARKFQAMQAYQAEIAQPGADPLKAILKYGPAMGQQASAEAAAIRASQMAARQGPGGLPNVPVMKLGTSQEEFAMFPRPSGSGFQPVRLGAGAGIAEREMKKLQITMDDKDLSRREAAHATARAARNAKLSDAELAKIDKEVGGGGQLQQQVRDWKEEDKALKAERAALKERVKTLGEGGGGGGRRGKWNPQTRQVDWNVGTLPPDMTQVGAPASDTEEQDQEAQ